jgi:hypothetical protein
MATRNLSIRLSVEDWETVKRQLKDVGEEGQEALERIEEAGEPASAGLKLVDGAASGVRETFDDAARSAGPFGSMLTRLGPVGAAAAAGLIALGIGLKLALKQAGEAAKMFDEVAENAREMGVSVRVLEDFRAVALTVGAPVSDLDSAVSGFIQSARQARRGSHQWITELEKVDKALGSAVRQTRSNEAALDLVVRKLAATSDASERAALAYAAFGEEGRTMLRITQDGAVAFDAMRAAARDTGLALNQYLVAEGENVRDELTRLETQIDKNLKEAFVGFGPVLVWFKGLWADLVGVLRDVIMSFRGIEVQTTETLKTKLAEINEQIALSENKLSDGATGKFQSYLKGRLDDLLKHRAKIDGILKGRKSAASKAANLPPITARKPLEITVRPKRRRRSSRRSGSGGLSEAERIRRALNDIANDKALARLSALDRETVRFAKRLRLSTTDIDAFVKAADMGRLQEAPAKILKLRDALDGLGMAKEGAKLMDDTRTNAERLQERLERLKDLLNAGEIDWETYSRAVAKVRDEFGKAALAAAGLDNLGKEVGSAIAGSFKDAIREGKDLVGTLKDIGLKLSDIALNAAFKPVEKFLGSVFDNMFSGFMGGLLKSADGNVFAQGDVVPFASGGLVTRPTFFPMARGGVGLMGEAGPEAIMPLKRDGQGRLGVVSGGGNTAPVSITFNVTTPDAGSFTRSEGQITAMLNRAVARGRRGL